MGVGGHNTKKYGVWDESWGGELKIYEENGPVHKVVDYAPGRIIVFDSVLITCDLLLLGL